MSDVLTSEQRSYCMSRNRGTNTGPELALRKALWAANLRYRLAKTLFGKPDLVFPASRLAIFIDGCFWHGCPLHYKAPTKDAARWHKKIVATKERDNLVREVLENEGWRVLRLWEHSIKQDLPGCVNMVRRRL